MDAYDSTDGPMAPDRLSSFERQLLSALAADGEQPPAGLAIALETDLGTVLETVAALRQEGLVAREGFSTCRLTAAGRDLLDDRGTDGVD
jgi:DNA-binding Lrp family transcriptional regulator